MTEPTTKPRDLDQEKRLLAEVLPLMSRHASDFNPASFAIWYEYARGHSELRDVLGEIVKQGGRIDARSALDLYEYHLLTDREQALLNVRGGMAGLLEKVDATLNDTVSSVAAYARTVEDFARDLTDEHRQVLGEQLDRLLTQAEVLHETLSRAGEQLQAGCVASSELTAELAIRIDDSSRKSVVPTVLDPAQVGREPFEKALRTLSAQAAGTQQRHCVVMVEIDRLDRLAGAHGSAAKDVVIDLGSRSIAAALRKGDQLGLFGDGRAAIILRNTTADDAEVLTERIRQRLRDTPIRLLADGTTWTLSGSLGMAILRNGEMVESVIGRAYRASQRARMRGGNQCALDS